MRSESREALNAYYEAAGSWASDRESALRASLRTAWVAALCIGFIALAEGFALIALTPLKTIVPYTLLVDRQTGYVQTLKPFEPNMIAPDAALTQSFLVQYVLAREEFDVGTIQSSYRKAALWSTGDARADYLSSIQVSNPESPLVRLPRTTLIEARVRSVSALGNRRALVRFDTIRRDSGRATQQPQAWIAIIDYRFSREPMSVEDRYINPLGFQVTRYRRNAETLGLPTSNPAATEVRQR